MNLILGITTFNRVDFLRRLIGSWNRTRSKSHNWTLIIADDGSSDGTRDFIDKISIPRVEVIKLENCRRGIQHQTNTILQVCAERDFDLCFKCDDDIVFYQSGWEKLYLDAIEETGFEHLCFYDVNWGKKKRGLSFKTVEHSSGKLICETEPYEVQGAFWTVTPNILRDVGYFDVEGFCLWGWGHTDYTWRCCKAGYNEISNPYDAKGSNDYLGIPIEGYKGSITDTDREGWNTPEIVERKKALLKDGSRIYIPYNESKYDLNRQLVSGKDLSFIIPYRERKDQVEGLIENLERIFGHLKIEIIFACQDDGRLFRRGQLCNLGYKKSTGRVVIFQDVDIRHLHYFDFESEIRKAKHPILAFTEISQLSGDFQEIKVLKTEPRYEGFGACGAFTREQFESSNGFSNLIIGWGAEDNVMNERSGMVRIKNTLGHISHPSHPNVWGEKWHMRNVFCWYTDVSRDRNLDSYRETIAEERPCETLGGKDYIKMYHFSEISVPESFPYRYYLDWDQEI